MKNLVRALYLKSNNKPNKIKTHIHTIIIQFIYKCIMFRLKCKIKIVKKNIFYYIFEQYA